MDKKGNKTTRATEQESNPSNRENLRLNFITLHEESFIQKNNNKITNNSKARLT